MTSKDIFDYGTQRVIDAVNSSCLKDRGDEHNMSVVSVSVSVK